MSIKSLISILTKTSNNQSIKIVTNSLIQYLSWHLITILRYICHHIINISVIIEYYCESQTGDYSLVGFKFSNKISNAVNTTFSSPADIITDYTNGLMYVADKFHNRIVYCYLNSTDNCRQYTMTWSTYGSTCTSSQCPGSGSTC